jgi:tripartite-type tricarboxylate transporter receptor subunit TctC
MPLKTTVLPITLMVAVAAQFAHAQNTQRSDKWPDKPVRVIVPFAPGGAGDIIARLVTPRLAETFGQTFIVDNRAGAGGSIGAELMVRANPDGYTLMVGASSYSANAAFYKLSWDAINGVAPVTLITRGPFVLVINPSVKAANLKEFIELLRTKPGALTFGSSGTGTVPHLAGELLMQLSKTRMVHAPYKGDGPAIVDLLGGHIQVYFGGPIVVTQHINAGKLRALAVSTEQRVRILPDLPTVNEVVPGYAVATWHGLWAPLGTPKEIVSRLNQAVGRILKTPDMQERLSANGLESGHGTPEEFNRFISQEIVKYTKVVKDGNIRSE